ncbi:winged helix-turn-helix domain-containing protein [Acidisoma sp. L85]|uniref:ATP-binding protein n=1 Tax=Acidisoma sp. L85 TaxID=1641850 RepID=UPI00131E97BA|nr:winged helix-turn-helix domain-containing protein [Acidisoma sp. L85]
MYRSGEWEIDLGRRELRWREVVVPIGSRAFEIVEVLLQSAGELVTKDQIMARVWAGAVVEESTLQVHIWAIRKALGADRIMLKTSPGRGYQLLGDWTPLLEAPEPRPILREAMQVPTPPFATNFPAALSDLIGRAAAIHRLRDRLTAFRAVTLTGPGGIGKTVLALQVARDLFPSFGGDARLVELGSLSDAGLVPSVAAAALGLKLGGDAISSESVARAIGDKRLLLVLDNCEHLVDAAAVLVDTIVRLCSHVTILATSREVLGIPGECVYRIPPLDVPPQNQDRPDDILKHSAVQFFISRAMALDSTFSADAPNLPVVAAICRRLDGIPLAIEFAAARTATLGLREVETHLNDRFGLLTNGGRTALPRHQTLRATLDWSYELLPMMEKRLLRRLAIFPAGFTLDAATAVMSDPDGDSYAVLDGVANLVAKSLVTQDGSADAGRWRMLETTRVYALAKLTEGGETQQVAQRHAEYFRDLVAPSSPSSLPPIFGRLDAGASGRAATEGMARLSLEIDNIRAALDWSFSPAGKPEIGIVLTAAYASFWLYLDLLVEFGKYAERSLESPHLEASLMAPMLLQLLLAFGIASLITMRAIKRHRTAFARALEIATNLQDTGAQLGSLWGQCLTDSINGDSLKALHAAEHFASVAYRSGDPTAVVLGERLLGIALHDTGNLREAQRHLERVIEHHAAPKQHERTFLSLYDHRIMARAMRARVLWLQGFVDQAIDQAAVSYEEAEANGHKLSICWVTHIAAFPVALMTDDLPAAEQKVARLNEFATNVNAAFWKVVSHYMEGKLLIKRREFDKGSRLLRAAFDLCEQTGWTMFFPESLGALAEGYAGLGQLSAALVTIDEALARADLGGQRWYLAELMRAKGELLLLQTGDGSVVAAEECFEGALELARQQNALSWELRTATSLASLRIKQNRPADARQCLAHVYERFTEGFGTADLRAAGALLETLPPAGGPVKKYTP